MPSSPQGHWLSECLFLCCDPRYNRKWPLAIYVTTLNGVPGFALCVSWLSNRVESEVRKWWKWGFNLCQGAAVCLAVPRCRHLGCPPSTWAVGGSEGSRMCVPRWVRCWTSWGRGRERPRVRKGRLRDDSVCPMAPHWVNWVWSARLQ